MLITRTAESGKTTIKVITVPSDKISRLQFSYLKIVFRWALSENIHMIFFFTWPPANKTHTLFHTLTPIILKSVENSWRTTRITIFEQSPQNSSLYFNFQLCCNHGRNLYSIMQPAIYNYLTFLQEFLIDFKMTGAKIYGQVFHINWYPFRWNRVQTLDWHDIIMVSIKPWRPSCTNILESLMQHRAILQYRYQFWSTLTQQIFLKHIQSTNSLKLISNIF